MIKIVEINRGTGDAEFLLFMEGIFGAERDLLNIRLKA